MAVVAELNDGTYEIQQGEPQERGWLSNVVKVIPPSIGREQLAAEILDVLKRPSDGER